MLDCQQIVEYSYAAHEMRYTARFLDGSTITLPVADLPQAIVRRKHHWAYAKLTDDRSTLLIPRQLTDDWTPVPAHVFHARGKVVEAIRITTVGCTHVIAKGQQAANA